MGIASDLILLFSLAFVLGLVAYQFRQPLFLGYILAGVLLSSKTPGIIVSNTTDISLLAEIGVALLLFTIGLEFSFKDLKPVKKIAVYGTALQIGLTILFGVGVAYLLLGLDWTASIWFGAIISSSNTVVLLKILMNQGRMGTLSSKVMIGMVIVQDLLMMPLLVFLPQISGPSFDVTGFLWIVFRAAVFIALLVIVGRKVLPWVMRYVALMGSREIFTLGITVIGLGIGYITYLIGLSFPLGAFLAGMILSESDFGHQGLIDITPLRDIFVLIFFASVGMLLDPAFVFENIGLILLMVAILSIGKGIILAGVGHLFGYGNVVPLAMAFTLFTLGESSFLLSRLGFTNNAITQETYSLILSVAIFTIILAPIVAGQVPRVYAWRNRWFKTEQLASKNIPKEGLANHVVIAGGGRVGLVVAKILDQLKFSCVILEANQSQMDRIKETNIPFVFGDASHEIVLNAAELKKANLFLITIPNMIVAAETAKQARKTNPDIRIIMRVSDSSQLDVISHAEDPVEVVVPVYEGSLEMTRRALLHLNVKAPEVQYCTELARQRMYDFQHQRFDTDEYQLLSQLRQAEHGFELQWIVVNPNSLMVGKTLEQLRVRQETGVSVVGVQQGDRLTTNPGPDFRIMENDILAVIGGEIARRTFQEKCMSDSDIYI